jgi:predicted AAA+ superfamily ATPase
MVKRVFWTNRLERAWQRRSIIWLMGVRRVGKTVLCQSLPDVEYFDCERPEVREQTRDPEAFLSFVRNKRVVLDEIHRLGNPSELLKIAADHYPDVKMIATGSSTLSASTKFRDTLTGRKTQVWLTPMMSADLVGFGGADLRSRLLYGGLPSFFLAGGTAASDYQEWMDDYWARDIQELFRLERRWGFQRCLELLLAQSGGIFEANKLAGPCEIGRTSVSNYAQVLEDTHVLHLVRPFSNRRSDEIVRAPKAYGFDTGFVAYFRGWTELRPEDLGLLWEHYVLNEIHARAPLQTVNYWRDKDGHEIDFVLVPHGKPPVAIECKWSWQGADLRNLRSFRRRYPEGQNWLVAQNVTRPFPQRDKDMVVEFMGLEEMVRRLEAGL